MALPYVNEAKDIEKALRLIRFATTPEQVKQDFVKNILEIPDQSNEQIRSFLRHIRFVNDDGSPTDLYKKFRNNSTVEKAAADALRFGYAPLYERYDNLHELDDDKLSKAIAEETGQGSSKVPLIFASIKAIKKFAKWSMTHSEVQISRTILYIAAFVALIYGLSFLLSPSWLFDLSQDQEVLANPGWVRWSGGLLIGVAVAASLAAANPERQKTLVLGLAVGTFLIALSLLYGISFGEYRGVQWFVLVPILINLALAVALAWVSTKQTTVNRSLMREMYGQVVGSDLESGYTFMYTWLANQFGHFMIGFAGALAWMWLWSILLGWQTVLSPQCLCENVINWQFLLHPQTLCEGVIVGSLAAAWLLGWILKELLCDIIPGLKNVREARQKRIKDTEKWYRKTGAKQTASHDRSAEKSFMRDLRRDSCMDIWFYSCGVLTALTMLYGPALADTWGKPWLAGGLPLLTFFILLFLSRWRSTEWLWRNIAFDKARLPFVSRFALTKRPFEKVTREAAINFALKNQNNNHSALNSNTKHIVIIGPPKSGRTTAAVALGVEALLRTEPPANIVRYITLPKLLDRIIEGSQEEATPAFPPEEADLLIVDDVGAQTPAGPLLTYRHFANVLRQALSTSDSLRAAAKTKRVIWVVGDNPDNEDKWKNALEGAFKAAFKPFRCDSKVYSIFLTDPIPPDERRRPMQHAKGATHAQMHYGIPNLFRRREQSRVKT